MAKWWQTASWGLRHMSKHAKPPMNQLYKIHLIGIRDSVWVSTTWYVSPKEKFIQFNRYCRVWNYYAVHSFFCFNRKEQHVKLSQVKFKAVLHLDFFSKFILSSSLAAFLYEYDLLILNPTVLRLLWPKQQAMTSYSEKKATFAKKNTARLWQNRHEKLLTFLYHTKKFFEILKLLLL